MGKKIYTAWQRLVQLLAMDKRDIRQICYYAIFTGMVALSLPLGIQAIINLIQLAQVSSSWIILVILVTIGTGFQGSLQLMQMRILENIQQKIFTRASFEFAYRFPKIKLSELSSYYPPELANRFFDILTVQKGLSKILLDLPAAFLQIVFGLILLSFYHQFFILYGFLLVFLMYLVFKLTIKRGLDTSLQESKSKYKVAHWIQEVARSIISFKLSGNTKLAMSRNDTLTSSYLEARESHFKILKLQFIQMIGFKVLITAGLLIIGGLLVLKQQMNIGQFVASEIIILLVISSVEKIIVGLESIYDVLTSLEKIGQVVDKDLEAQEGDELSDDPNSPFQVEVYKLGFKNPQGMIELDRLEFMIQSNDRIWLQGTTGDCETALLKILSGLEFPTSGTLYINNQPISGLELNSYRSLIGQVLPNQTTFEGTILENITFGNPLISQKRVDEVITELGLVTFVKNQPKGIHSSILSDGQQLPHTISKRIVLARSIVHNPRLLLLKDPLEHFDPNEASQIMKYLTDSKQPWALVVSSYDPKWKSFCNYQMTLNVGQENIKRKIHA